MHLLHDKGTQGVAMFHIWGKFGLGFIINYLSYLTCICDVQAGYRGEWSAPERTGNKRSETSQENWLTSYGYCSFWTSTW